MKSFFLIGILFLTTIIFAQENNTNEIPKEIPKKTVTGEKTNFTITLGTNLIDNNNNSGKSIPFIGGNLAFKTPFFIAAEHRFNSDFATSLSLSTNQLETKTGNKLYMAVDAFGQFYFNDYIFYSEDVETYIGLGVGHYVFENKGNNTVNFSGGVRYWFSQSYGVVAQGIGRVGLPPVNEQVKNIYQVGLGLVWRN
jgi:hypothetical protein